MSNSDYNIGKLCKIVNKKLPSLYALNARGILDS